MQQHHSHFADHLDNNEIGVAQRVAFIVGSAFNQTDRGNVCRPPAYNPITVDTPTAPDGLFLHPKVEHHASHELPTGSGNGSSSGARTGQAHVKPSTSTAPIDHDRGSNR